MAKEVILGLGCLFLLMFWLVMASNGLALSDQGRYAVDAKVKTTKEWEEENMTNKERVARWREEQKKKSD